MVLRRKKEKGEKRLLGISGEYKKAPTFAGGGRHLCKTMKKTSKGFYGRVVTPRSVEKGTAENME